MDGFCCAVCRCHIGDIFTPNDHIFTKCCDKERRCQTTPKNSREKFFDRPKLFSLLICTTQSKCFYKHDRVFLDIE